MLSTAPPRPWRSTTSRRTLQLTSRRSSTRSTSDQSLTRWPVDHDLWQVQPHLALHCRPELWLLCHPWDEVGRDPYLRKQYWLMHFVLFQCTKYSGISSTSTLAKWPSSSSRAARSPQPRRPTPPKHLPNHPYHELITTRTTESIENVWRRRFLGRSLKRSHYFMAIA